VQGAITAYTLVMAMFMILGGKVGALIGRKRAFMIGCIVNGSGSLTTALAPSLPVLLLGWPLLEGIGAALIMPAIVALVAAAGRWPSRWGRSSAVSRRRTSPGAGCSSAKSWWCSPSCFSPEASPIRGAKRVRTST
jgi:MFS family permease